MRRVDLFLKFIGVKGGSLEERARSFVNRARENPNGRSTP